MGALLKNVGGSGLTDCSSLTCNYRVYLFASRIRSVRVPPITLADLELR